MPGARCVKMREMRGPAWGKSEEAGTQQARTGPRATGSDSSSPKVRSTGEDRDVVPAWAGGRRGASIRAEMTHNRIQF